ncbi:MAG TPA: hypothetical protein VIL85_08830 [Thermomicrobiales bacterium]
MLTTSLRAIAPGTHDAADRRAVIVPRPDNVPIALADNHGDFACGHCGLTLLRGALAGRRDEDRAVGAGARGLLVRCPGCGWDNAVPRE